MSEQASKDATTSTSSKKSHISKDVEQSESAKLFCLNSTDYGKSCLATYIEDRHKRSRLVKFRIYSKCRTYTHTYTNGHTYIIIYLNTHPVCMNILSN